MPAPRGKHSRYPGATRPWNVPQVKQAETEADYNYRLKLSTHDSKEKIDVCLSCGLPECQPKSSGCQAFPRKNKTGPGHKLKPPEEFLRWGWGPMTNQEWASELGVSVSTILRWRREYGLQRL